MKKLDMVQIKETKDLHNAGLSTYSIALKLGITRSAVGYRLKTLGLKAHRDVTPIKFITKDTAKCKECGEVLPLTAFYKKGKSYLAFCSVCYGKRIKMHVNSNLDSFLKYAYNGSKSRAKKHKTPFKLTFKIYKEQYISQLGKCFYTDHIMDITLGNGINKYKMSIDKILPTKGYVKGNFVFCTVFANTTKGDMTLEEVKYYLPTFYKKLKQKL
jgi:hypothetical protein